MEWVSVKDRLPEDKKHEDEEDVLIFYRGRVCLGYYDSESEYSKWALQDSDSHSGYCMAVDSDVTHWMPIELPKNK